MSRHPVPIDDGMLISAVRYALGRQSYIVGATCDEVRTVWPQLSANTRRVIARDIGEALAQPGRIGMEMDHQGWWGLHQWMADQ